MKSLLAFSFAAIVALALALDFVHPDIASVDFHTYLAAAVVGLQQGWTHIYDEPAVAAAQHQIAPHLWSQPFLSTPPVAWLAAPFAALPYPLAYFAFATLTLVALAAALAWSTGYRGAARWIAAAAALVPWWVLHSFHVGQVAPLLAAAVIVAWRLLREERDVAAGLVLVVILFKPNTAALVPVALLLTGRSKSLLAWLGGAAVVGIASVALIGPHGMSAYLSDLSHVSRPELRGAAQLTVASMLGLSPVMSAVVRGAIAVATLATMYRYRREPGMALAAGAVGSLLTTTYLHGSDLCLLLAAGWIAWHERPAPLWRAVLAGVWLLATPFLDGSMFAPPLNRWVVCEVVVLFAFVIDAWLAPRLASSRVASLTGWAASGRQAPA